MDSVQPKRRRNVDKNFLTYATAITYLLAYVLPCRQIDEWKKVFGYPFGWFTIFNDTIGDTIISSTATNLSHLIGNVIFWYAILYFLRKAKYEFTNRQQKSIDHNLGSR